MYLKFLRSELCVIFFYLFYINSPFHRCVFFMAFKEQRVCAERFEESCVLARLRTFVSFRPGLPGGHQMLSMCTPNRSGEYSNS